MEKGKQSHVREGVESAKGGDLRLQVAAADG